MGIGTTKYISTILVPEVGSRLIMEDFQNITLEEARNIMIESVEYGRVMYRR